MFIDIACYNWHPPRHVGSSPAAALLPPGGSLPVLDLPPAALALGPRKSGAAAVEECDGIAALEAVRFRYCDGSFEEALRTCDGNADAAATYVKYASWARRLQDVFFDEEDGGGEGDDYLDTGGLAALGGGGGGVVPPSGPAVTTAGTFAFGAAAAAAASLPPAGRGRGATLPAWMTTAKPA